MSHTQQELTQQTGDYYSSLNLARWRYYMKDVTSPDSFIDMGFYYLISAALQRRVFWGSETRPLFPNLYIILTGDPAVGKGLVLNEVIKCLKYHKLVLAKTRASVIAAKTSTTNQQQPTVPPMQGGKLIAGAPNKNFQNRSTANFRLNNTAKDELSKLLLFPVAPDSTTFEGVVRFNAVSNRVYYIEALKEISPELYETTKESKLLVDGTYPHSSIAFALEEISSLFRKHTEDVTNYLIRAFDCGDYDYRPKTGELQDMVEAPCLAFIGGTTPKFMLDAFSDNLVSDGFCSRTLFIYEHAPRSYRFDISEVSKEQLEARQEILKHILNLSKLFGPCKFSPEAHAFMKHHFENVHPYSRTNTSPKLESYYGRKKVHTIKLAMAMHYADSLEPEIGIACCREALRVLEQLENRMHLALNFGGLNPLASVGKRVVKYLTTRGAATKVQIWIDHAEDLNSASIDEVLNYLLVTEQIAVTTDERTKKQKYEVKRK